MWDANQSEASGFITRPLAIAHLAAARAVEQRQDQARDVLADSIVAVIMNRQ